MIFSIARAIFRTTLLSLTLLLVAMVGFWVFAQYNESDRRDAVLPKEGRLIEVGGNQVYIEEAGAPSAQPILFVHGSVGWSGLWRDTMAAVAPRGYRAIAFDLAPMGYSDRDPAGGYGRISQSGRITQLARALDQKPILVAHSFGAGPALEAALRFPNQFAGLVIICGAIGIDSHQTDASLPLPLRPILFREMAVATTATNPWVLGPLLKLFLHRKDTVTDEQLAILKQPLRLRETTAYVAAWLPSLMLPPKDALSTRRDEIATLSIPSALVWGAEDTVTPMDQALDLSTLLPDAPLIVLEDIGHIPQIEGPEEFHKALMDALASVSG